MPRNSDPENLSVWIARAIALTMLALVAVAALIFLTSSASGQSHAPTADPPALSCYVPHRTYNVIVLRVVDGDTVSVSLDAGFNVHLIENARFWGIDAPERYQEGGPESAARLAELMPPGSSALAVSPSRPRDKYGRLLLRFYTPDCVDVGAALVAEGHARNY